MVQNHGQCFFAVLFQSQRYKRAKKAQSINATWCSTYWMVFASHPLTNRRIGVDEFDFSLHVFCWLKQWLPIHPKLTTIRTHVRCLLKPTIRIFLCGENRANGLVFWCLWRSDRIWHLADIEYHVTNQLEDVGRRDFRSHWTYDHAK